MNELGHFALCLAWGLTLIGIISGVLAGRTRSERWYNTARNCTALVFLCTAVAIGILAAGFLSNDYSNQFIWQFSNRAMDPIYKISAIWGGMDGSMLLWCFMLSVCGLLLAIRHATYPRQLMPWVFAVANSSTFFFLSVVVFLTNPFRFIKADFIPPDGNGLNPLLQNPYMAVHPPTLYVGFTSWSVPFAFCMAALLSGNLGNQWLRTIRNWSLFAWGFLTAGIVMGGHWAYVVLGWGGFWAWDPVENASFLPWLTGTAFLHSVMVQERKNMLKAWNIWLLVTTYGLTVFGTFLTRSGVVQSVHAFASTDIGWVFLVYLAALFLSAVFLTVLHRKALAPERRIESFLSREAAFLVNNLIFLSICFAILWGVMFPVLSEAVTGNKQTVGIPFFNAVNIPLFLLLIFLMGIGPLIAWRKATFGSIRKTFLAPFLSALAVGCILVWAGVDRFYPVLSYSLCFFVLMTTAGELHRGLKTQAGGGGPKGYIGGAPTLLRRYRTRYAGYLIHIGVLVVTIAITSSMAYKTEKEFTLAQGESFKVGRFNLKLDNFGSNNNENYEALFAEVSVSRAVDGVPVAQLHPELRYYLRNKETTTEVALHMGPREDVYLVLVGMSDEGRASFKLFINPLQIWLWIGALIMVGGTVILIVARPKTVTALAVQGAETVRA